jgi:hypothetical protein
MGMICVGESENVRPEAILAWEAWALSFAMGEISSDLACLLPHSPPE